MIFEQMHNGKLKRFRNRQTRHDCRKKMKGRPGVWSGICYMGLCHKQRRRVWNKISLEEYM